MELRPLQLTIHNARDLKEVNHFSKMDTYVIVSISGDPRTMQKTHVHNKGGTNPAWDFPMNFTLDENSLMQNRLTLHFKIKEYGKLRDKDIGDVIVSIKELFHTNNGDFSYSIKTRSGKAKGTFNFSCKFGDKESGGPIMAYPPPGVYAYPVPNDPYPAPGPGGHYPGKVKPPKKSSGMGGLGLGLEHRAGLLEGFLLGAAACADGFSDAADIDCDF